MSVAPGISTSTIPSILADSSTSACPSSHPSSFAGLSTGISEISHSPEASLESQPLFSSAHSHLHTPSTPNSDTIVGSSYSGNRKILRLHDGRNSCIQRDIDRSRYHESCMIFIGENSRNTLFWRRRQL